MATPVGPDSPPMHNCHQQCNGEHLAPIRRTRRARRASDMPSDLEATVPSDEVGVDMAQLGMMLTDLPPTSSAQMIRIGCVGDGDVIRIVSGSLGRLRRRATGSMGCPSKSKVRHLGLPASRPWFVLGLVRELRGHRDTG